MLAPPTNDTWTHCSPTKSCGTTTKGHNHAEDLEDVLHSIKKYNIRLNPTKWSFRVQDGKFLGFKLTKKGIEANLDKCQTVITTRSPTSSKEVKHFKGRVTTLFWFISCRCEKVFLFFIALKKKERFKWMAKCEEAFQRVKAFLTSPPIITCPRDESSLLFYLFVIDQVMNLILIHETYKAERPIDQKIKKLTLDVIITTRNLRPYFHRHKIFVKTNSPVRKSWKRQIRR